MSETELDEAGAEDVLSLDVGALEDDASWRFSTTAAEASVTRARKPMVNFITAGYT